MKSHGRLSSKPVSLRVNLAALVLALGGTACEVDEVASDAIDDAFVTDGYQAPSVPDPAPTAATCHAQRFNQPDAQITRKLDLLFITDTSSSLNDERGAVADGMDAFIAALPSNVDYRIGVMLAHSPSSTWSGKLYRRNSSDPYVLKSDTMTQASIKSTLRAKFTQGTATDNASDGGEEGLVSLNRALDDDRIALAQSQGFFRTDAALAVVFIADENDLCALYPTGVIPVVDTNGIEPVAGPRDCTRMAPAKMSGTTLITPSHQEAITPDLVLAKLRAFHGDMPLVISGVLYTDPALVPHVGGEDEVGYGYREFVQLAHGLQIELSTGDYDDGLNQIGTLASISMNLTTDFTLSQANVDASSIQVAVDGFVTDHVYSAENNQIHLDDPGQPLSVVDISYCENPPAPPVIAGVAPMCSAGAFAPKATLKVGLSSDPADGAMSVILSGLTSIGVTATVYTDSQIASGVPAANGVNVLIIARKVGFAPITQAYADGIKQFIQSGGSVFGEYDGAALLFGQFNGLAPSFTGHMPPSINLFDGNVAGGGLLLPTTASTMTVTDTADPIMAGLASTTISTGLRTAFAASGFNDDWLHPSAQFTSTGFGNLVPAGTFPAVMKGRCGGGRVELLMMNQLQVLGTSQPIKTIVTNSLNWLIGQ